MRDDNSRGTAPGPLVFGLVVWAGLFHGEIARAVEVWNASTAYGHCWLVLPIALYLAWDRRAMAAGIAIRPVLWAALLAFPATLVWFAAERTGIMEGRQLAAIGCVQLLFLAVLGWRLAWVFSAPLLYLFFLVPFGAFLTHGLQHVTAAFIDLGLDLLGIPYLIDQFTIEIPEGTFYVAEACAGLRFLIASIAFGVLYACLIYRSPWRRAAFILAACVVPVIANGVRALGIVVLGHLLGSAQAAAADHLIYGWVFFSAVILLLTLAGLPFRQDTGEKPAPRQPTPAPPPAAAPLWRTAILVMAIAAIGPALAAAIDRDAAAPSAATLPVFVAVPGCTAAPAPPGVQQFICNGFPLTAWAKVFSPRANPTTLVAAQRHAGAEDLAEDAVTGQLATAQGLVWRLVEAEKPDCMTATALWIDGDPGLVGLAGRLRQARNSLLGSGFAPVLMAVRIDGDGVAAGRHQHHPAREDTIRGFIDAQGDLSGLAVRLAGEAAR